MYGSQKHHYTKTEKSINSCCIKEREEIFEEDGATWFRSMTYGDDKNRVLIKTTVLTHT